MGFVVHAVADSDVDSLAVGADEGGGEVIGLDPRAEGAVDDPPLPCRCGTSSARLSLSRWPAVLSTRYII
jgi:hypothetical protein